MRLTHPDTKTAKSEGLEQENRIGLLIATALLELLEARPRAILVPGHRHRVIGTSRIGHRADDRAVEIGSDSGSDPEKQTPGVGGSVNGVGVDLAVQDVRHRGEAQQGDHPHGSPRQGAMTEMTALVRQEETRRLESLGMETGFLCWPVCMPQD
jgi:hypothetical protein